MAANHEADFTEAAYRDLVKDARSRFAFRRFADALSVADGVLWRHDIDMSPQRALALARIEHEEGVAATYFVHLHSNFYNALEADVRSTLTEIAGLNHEVGLHFDPQFARVAPADTEELSRVVALERDVLQDALGVRVAALSFHDPDVAGFTDLSDDTIAGLVNAYGPHVRGNFAYASDSNGYWRFAPIRDVLAAGHPRVQVLTHPEWWVPEPMSPRDRVERAIKGRADAALRRYDNALRGLGRDNKS